jgi:hypothetical protein
VRRARAVLAAPPPGRITFRAHCGGGSGEAEAAGAPSEDEIVIVVGG